MTNFDFLKKEPKFHSFADVAIAAERVLKIDVASSVINCRRAMEFAIKWMYSVDKSLEKPYQDNLVSLMSTEDFHDLVDDDLWKRLDLIRKIGNRAAHNGRKIIEDEAILCLQNLFIFMDYVSYCYSAFYEERQYDVKLLSAIQEEPTVKSADNDVDLEKLIAENKALKEELTARRKEQQQTYVPKPLDLSEYKTRKIYIDSMLLDAGWTEGKDWLNEVELEGMPNKSETGYADYVLYDDSQKYDTNFTDEILSTEWNESELENDELKNYKAKAEFYICQHQDNIVIAKLKTNKPLTETDVESLEHILWNEIGSKNDYEKEYGHKPLGEFVREIVGLDMNAAKEAFSEFLNDTNLDSRQIYFVNQIIEYIIHNGMMKDLSVLQESPFTDKGSVVEIFTDMNMWMRIKKTIDQINANAVA